LYCFVAFCAFPVIVLLGYHCFDHYESVIMAMKEIKTQQSKHKDKQAPCDICRQMVSISELKENEYQGRHLCLYCHGEIANCGCEDHDLD